MQRVEPYLGLTWIGSAQRWVCLFWGRFTGGAWLSSARVVRCWVKSRNERNPCSLLPARYGGDSVETAGVNSEEGGDDVRVRLMTMPGVVVGVSTMMALPGW